MWAKGALLFPAIGFYIYILNTGVADTAERMTFYCLPMGVTVGSIYGIIVTRVRRLHADLDIERYVARNRDGAVDTGARTGTKNIVRYVSYCVKDMCFMIYSSASAKVTAKPFLPANAHCFTIVISFKTLP